MQSLTIPRQAWCDQAFDLWQQLELASELEPDLWDTVDLGKKWSVDFSAEKTQLVSFDWSNNDGSIDLKMDGSVLEEKSSWVMLWWPSLPNWVVVLILSLLLKLPPRKLELYLILWSFFLRRWLCISMNLPYTHVWNTVVMSGLVPLVATSFTCFSLEPLAHHWNVANLGLFYRYYFGRCSSELAQLVPLPFSQGLLVILINCMIFLSTYQDVTRMPMSTVSFLTQLDSGILCLWW